MYSDHPLFRLTVGDDARMWRFCSVAKLLSLLASRSLHFARTDTLGDPYEGSLPRAIIDQIKAMDPESAEVMRRQYEWNSENTYVNCWHLSEHESAALWQAHAAHGGGVALRTTPARLKRSLGAHTDDSVWIGEVSYWDYDLDAPTLDPNIMAPLLWKRRSFEHEREIRAVVWRPAVEADPATRDAIAKEGGPTLQSPGEALIGVQVAVDLDILLTAVYVPPASPPWHQQGIETTVRRFGLSCPVVRSGLLDAPIW